MINKEPAIIKSKKFITKGLTFKEQKKYLLDKIDDAIEKAPFEDSYIFNRPNYMRDIELSNKEKKEINELREKNIKEFGTVTIKIPGNIEFIIYNTKTALKKLRKRVLRLSDIQLVEKKPSLLPIKGRIRGENVRYYNKYTPKKVGIIERPKGDEKRMYYSKGYISDGTYLIKASKIKIKGETADQTPDFDGILKINGDYKPATIVGVFHYGITNKDNINVHVVSNSYFFKTQIISIGEREKELKTEEKISAYVDVRYVDSIFTEHPTTKVFIKDSDWPVVFKEDGFYDEIVGIIAPFNNYGADSFIMNGYERVTGEKLIKDR